MYPLLWEWINGLDRLKVDLARSLKNEDPLLGNPLICYDEYAYRGVTLFVDILIKYFASSKDVLQMPLL